MLEVPHVDALTPHTVLLSLGSSTPFWTIKNSWGVDWGQQVGVRVDGGCGVGPHFQVPSKRSSQHPLSPLGLLLLASGLRGLWREHHGQLSDCR